MAGENQLANFTFQLMGSVE